MPRRASWVLAVVAVVANFTAMTLTAEPAIATNAIGAVGAPTIPTDAPDPEVVWDGERFWMFTTQVSLTSVPARSSADLQTWSAPTEALPQLGAWAAWGWTWSPGVIEIEGVWTMYYTAHHAASDRQCIGRATASSPGGPYEDHAASPFICQLDDGGSIDADTFEATDGTRWLLWKSDGNAIGQPTALWSAPLLADGSALAAAPTRLLQSSDGIEAGIIENPTMVADGARYHLLFSAGPYESDAYLMHHASCSGPAGPCTRDGYGAGPWLGTDIGVPGPGGGSVFTDHLGRPWLAFHGWRGATGYGNGGVRASWLVPLDLGTTPVIRFDLPRHRDHRRPIGSIDATTVGGDTLSVQGWVADDDFATTPVTAVVSVSSLAGTFSTSVLANGSRPDIATAIPRYGEYHGFTATLPSARGVLQVCVDADDLGPGGRSRVTCRTVDTGPSRPAIGNLEAVSPSGTSAVVTGWAVDPDHSHPASIEVSVNGVGVISAVASGNRPDIHAVFGLGAAHGFAVTVPLPSGLSTVCVRAVDLDALATSSLLGCRTVMRATGAPFGNIDSIVRRPGGVALSGWTLDPDTTAPAAVHAWSGGQLAGYGWADRTRSDIGRVFTGYGDAHGFTVDVALGSGSRSVCVYGIESSGGAHGLLGCPVVEISDVPIGNLDGLVRSSTSASVQGWALDPDVARPIEIHVLVDGQLAGWGFAGGSRPDVGTVFPYYGQARGFSIDVPLASGGGTVCVYAINAAPGIANRLLGCG